MNDNDVDERFDVLIEFADKIEDCLRKFYRILDRMYRIYLKNIEGDNAKIIRSKFQTAEYKYRFTVIYSKKIYHLIIKKHKQLLVLGYQINSSIRQYNRYRMNPALPNRQSQMNVFQERLQRLIPDYNKVIRLFESLRSKLGFKVLEFEQYIGSISLDSLIEYLKVFIEFDTWSDSKKQKYDGLLNKIITKLQTLSSSPPLRTIPLTNITNSSSDSD